MKENSEKHIKFKQIIGDFLIGAFGSFFASVVHDFIKGEFEINSVLESILKSISPSSVLPYFIIILLVIIIARGYSHEKILNILNITTPPLVKKCNEIRKYIEKNGLDKSYTETKKFDSALEFICRKVYEALTNKTEKSTGFNRYGINVLLLSSDSLPIQSKDMYLNLIKADGLKSIRDDYSIAFGRNKGENLYDTYKLLNNTPYYECLTQYNNGVAHDLIQVYTDVKNKIKEGNYKSALNGYWEFPYDSIIVVPILPLYNHNKVTLEGFFNVISDKEPFNDDKGFTDEHKAFLEAVSGFFYDVCKNYEQP